MKSKVKKGQFCIWVNVLICSAMFFFLAASVWIRQKYGELLFATVDREFMNFLENKRTPTHASGFQLFTVAMTGHAEKWVQLPQHKVAVESLLS